MNNQIAMCGTQLRWPAEWEPQEAVWLSWPHRRDLWQGGLDELLVCYAQLAAAISARAEVRINAAAALHPSIHALLQRYGVSGFLCGGCAFKGKRTLCNGTYLKALRV